MGFHWPFIIVCSSSWYDKYCWKGRKIASHPSNTYTIMGHADTAMDCTTGHWCCFHGTNTKLLKPLYRLLYNRRRISMLKEGREIRWRVRRHFLWRIRDTDTYIAWENPHISTVTVNSNLQIVFVSSLFHDVYFFSWLFWRTIRWRHALNGNVYVVIAGTCIAL